MFIFSENLPCFGVLLPPFWDSPICLITDELVPSAKAIHYWTDSPTSQHRNKNIFYINAHHEELFGISAAWNYFKASHGKGPCDSIGGTTKRMADGAVKQRKFFMQGAYDIYFWA